MVDSHACVFPEVVIEEGDDVGVLQVGDRVLAPCECGDQPLDHLEFTEGRMAEMQAALLAYDPDRPLFHWSPASRRKQILRYGLRPGMRVTTVSSPMGGMAVCFADSASWAWALSGDMRWTPAGEWDLWQVPLSSITEPIVLASDTRKSGIYEVRTEHRVYKRDIWYVGSRVK